MYFWGDDRRYNSYSGYFRRMFGGRMQKLSVNAGFSCPNRDGTLDTRGCIFCSSGGSGEFASPFRIGENPEPAFHQAYLDGIASISGKSAAKRYIVYFQAYTNTYGPVSYLDRLYRLALNEPSCAGISIATRPDALPDEVIKLLDRLRKEYAPKFVWVELGLQTIHPKTAAFIRRGYDLSCFEDAVRQLKAAGLTVIVHLILGLPGETKDQMLQSVDYIAHFTPAIDGIKLQLLHVLKETDLAAIYNREPFPFFRWRNMQTL